MKRRRSEAHTRRRAFTLVEIVVCALMLGIAMSVTLHILTWVAAERRAIEQRACAVREVANIMERITARPWSELTPDTLKGVTLSDSTRAALPGAELTIDVENESPTPVSRRLAVRLRWRGASGNFERPVRLSAWAYPRRNER